MNVTSIEVKRVLNFEWPSTHFLYCAFNAESYYQWAPLRALSPKNDGESAPETGKMCSCFLFIILYHHKENIILNINFFTVAILYR